MSANIVYAILVTSVATFLSRFLGVVSSQGIKETSKLFEQKAALITGIEVQYVKEYCKKITTQNLF